MYKIFDFECFECKAVFEDMVLADQSPDICISCGSRGPFERVIAAPAIPTAIVVDYPGSKRFKAGYTHVYNRPAERKGSQVSMYAKRNNK